MQENLNWKKINIFSYYKLKRFYNSLCEESKNNFTPRFCRKFVFFVAYMIFGDVNGYYLTKDNNIIAVGWTNGFENKRGLAVCVSKEFQGKKIGTAIIERLQEDSTKDIAISVFEDNKPALQLYKKLGFKEKRKIKTLEWKKNE